MLQIVLKSIKMQQQGWPSLDELVDTHKHAKIVALLYTKLYADKNNFLQAKAEFGYFDYLLRSRSLLETWL